MDSVAEHQPTNVETFKNYLHFTYHTIPYGLALLILNVSKFKQSSFLLVYAAVAYFFSTKMTRLVLLTGPMAASLSGIAIGFVADWCVAQLFWSKDDKSSDEEPAEESSAKKPTKSTTPKKPKSSGSKKPTYTPFSSVNTLLDQYFTWYESKQARVIRLAAIFLILAFAVSQKQTMEDFRNHSFETARHMSNPMIVFKARLKDGKEVIINDYVQAYTWLRESTPRTSRVMAWWDYGYQITGIGNRTTIADGNTWNHEHIATLGYCLTSPTARAHELIRHLADYVLVWSGGGGDDLAKSPHMARIANSVYNDLCPGDPTCSHFGFYQDGNPTPWMSKSLLFNLISNGMRPGAKVDPKYFTEVYSSPYRLVRIYKVTNVSIESKKWVMDPANRKCDAPGSWYCSGQYPPAEPIQKLLAKKRDFKQLEDFNRGGGVKGNKYYEEYMANMEGRRTASQTGSAHDEDEEPEMVINAISDEWQDTPLTTRMWTLIRDNDLHGVQEWLSTEKEMVNMRSSDGRGPLWWAYENNNKEMIALLKKFGAKETEKDKNGKRPRDLLRQ